MLDAGSGKVKYWKAGFHYMNERKTEVENAAEGTSKGFSTTKYVRNGLCRVQSVKGRQSRVVERHSRVHSVKGCQTRVVERHRTRRKGFSTSKYFKSGFHRC